MSPWTSSPLVVGHRGGRGNGWPAENTLPAFEQARVAGARAIELDVRTCATGECVVFHDLTLDRMTGGRDARRVDSVPFEELRAIDLGGGARVPTLAEVLEWATARAVAVNVEMKHDVPRRDKLARVTMAAVAASRAEVLLSSFDPILLALAAALDRRVKRAFLTEADAALWAKAVQAITFPAWTGALHIERTQATSSALARYARRGLRVGVWTVNDPGEARELVRLGAATIITDAPGIILAGLAANHR